LEKPIFWIVAGPNGAGKSTVVNHVLDKNIEVLNPDEYARNQLKSGSKSALFMGSKHILEDIETRLHANQKSSFGIETTFSGKYHLRIMHQAKEKGWMVGLLFIGTDSYEMNIWRVRQRIQRGGHYVGPAEIKRRYYRCLSHLSEGLQIADIAYVYDNTSDSMQLLVSKCLDGKLEAHARFPSWLKELSIAALENVNPVYQDA